MAQLQTNTKLCRLISNWDTLLVPTGHPDSPLTLSKEQPSTVVVDFGGPGCDSYGTTLTHEMPFETFEQFQFVTSAATDSPIVVSELCNGLEQHGESAGLWGTLTATNDLKEPCGIPVNKIAGHSVITVSSAGTQARQSLSFRGVLCFSTRLFAGMAAVLSRLPQLLPSAVATLYEIADAETERFLMERSRVAEALLEAAPIVEFILRPKGRSVVTLTRFSEDPGDMEVMVRIPTDAPVNEAMARLARFDEQWWLEQPAAVRQLLVFDVEFC